MITPLRHIQTPAALALKAQQEMNAALSAKDFARYDVYVALLKRAMHDPGFSRAEFRELSKTYGVG